MKRTKPLTRRAEGRFALMAAHAEQIEALAERWERLKALESVELQLPSQLT